MEKKLLFTIILGIYLAAMLFFSVSPSVPTIVSFRNSDKLMHFFEFFIFTILLMITLQYYKIKYSFLITISAAVVLAFITEIMQLFISTRSFCTADLLFDILGILIGVLARWKS